MTLEELGHKLGNELHLTTDDLKNTAIQIQVDGETFDDLALEKIAGRPVVVLKSQDLDARLEVTSC